VWLCQTDGAGWRLAISNSGVHIVQRCDKCHNDCNRQRYRKDRQCCSVVAFVTHANLQRPTGLNAIISSRFQAAPEAGQIGQRARPPEPTWSFIGSAAIEAAILEMSNKLLPRIAANCQQGLDRTGLHPSVMPLSG
jgi:hypothetical protein